MRRGRSNPGGLVFGSGTSCRSLLSPAPLFVGDVVFVEGYCFGRERPSRSEALYSSIDCAKSRN